MIISQIKHTIDSLEQAIPLGFIFVMDTTDRSFVYKSLGRHDCVDEIIEMDQTHGIDRLMKDSMFYIHEEKKKRLILKKIGSNLFIGICLHDKEYDDSMLMKIKEILND